MCVFRWPVAELSEEAHVRLHPPQLLDVLLFIKAGSFMGIGQENVEKEIEQKEPQTIRKGFETNRLKAESNSENVSKNV